VTELGPLAGWSVGPWRNRGEPSAQQPGWPWIIPQLHSDSGGDPSQTAKLAASAAGEGPIAGDRRCGQPWPVNRSPKSVWTPEHCAFCCGPAALADHRAFCWLGGRWPCKQQKTCGCSVNGSRWVGSMVQAVGSASLRPARSRDDFLVGSASKQWGGGRRQEAGALLPVVTLPFGTCSGRTAAALGRCAGVQAVSAWPDRTGRAMD